MHALTSCKGPQTTTVPHTRTLEGKRQTGYPACLDLCPTKRNQLSGSEGEVIISPIPTSKRYLRLDFHQSCYPAQSEQVFIHTVLTYRLGCKSVSIIIAHDKISTRWICAAARHMHKTHIYSEFVLPYQSVQGVTLLVDIT